jgi:histidinol dehydrogenase
VLTRIDLRGRRSEDTRGLLPRAQLDVAAAVEQVRPVVEDVRDRGLAAVREATAKYDGVTVPEPRVPAQALADALAELDPAVRVALEEAAERLRRVCAAQLRDDVVVDVVPGATVTERWVPVGRVGLYVPGGLVAWPLAAVAAFATLVASRVDELD